MVPLKGEANRVRQCLYAKSLQHNDKKAWMKGFIVFIVDFLHTRIGEPCSPRPLMAPLLWMLVFFTLSLTRGPKKDYITPLSQGLQHAKMGNIFRVEGWRTMNPTRPVLVKWLIQQLRHAAFEAIAWVRHCCWVHWSPGFCHILWITIFEKNRYMLSLAICAFANSCPLQTDTFPFPLIHSHNNLLSSNKF